MLCLRLMAAAEHLAFVDLETTGGNPACDRITEVGIVRVRNGAQVDEWSALVNPECAISPYIQAFTGISSEMVATAPRFSELAGLIAEKLEGAVFVAHNARFDYAFLRSEFRNAGIQFSSAVLCTVKLSRRLFPEHARHNLDAVMQRHNLTCTARHRALGDAQVLRDLWLKLKRDVPSSAWDDAAAHAMLAAPRLPAHLPAALADELPDAPGAYRFFGEADALLFVGKGNSLRARVLAQLGRAQPTCGGLPPLAAEVRRVDWVQTSGELGSMLLEAQWLKSQRPRYNRPSKDNTQSATLQPAGDGSGRIAIRRIDGLELSELSRSFGVFHCEKDARKALTDIARAKQLCLKVLGLEETSGSCFALQVGKCRGACTGNEPILLHGVRAELALSKLKIKSWPFPDFSTHPKLDWHEFRLRA